jgi:hypothetical protein
MQMWQQVDPAALDSSAGGNDPPAAVGMFEDLEEDCLFGAEAQQCGSVPGSIFSTLP